MEYRMSRLVVDRLQGNAATGNKITVPTGHSLIAPGHTLQVVQSFKSDIWSSTTTSWIDISGLSVTITPKSPTSKFLVQGFLGRVSISGSTWYSVAFRFARNGTGIGVGDAAGSRPQSALNITHYDSYYDGNGAMMYLDSPNTSSPLTYSLQTIGHGSGTLQINYTESNADLATGYAARASSNQLSLSYQRKFLHIFVQLLELYLIQQDLVVNL
jgi:hypothetical protein